VSAETPTTWTIGALLNWTEQYFREHKIDSPRLDAQVLLAHVLNCRRTDLYVRFDVEPTAEQRAKFREMVKARAAGTPVAYLVGSKEFYLLEFAVSPAVLIPRPATETLVMAALEAIKTAESPRVLDLGTGSGCIAVTMAVQNKTATIVATDISQDALAIARRNTEKHNVAERIAFVESDLFAAVDVAKLFDAIVSNPPYIPSGDLAGLMKDVKEHEPSLALDGGPDGFAVINRIVEQAFTRLSPGRSLLIEVGAGQADAALQKFAAAGYTDVKVRRDTDGIARVVSGVKK
jgi:release factor glutamine methyltransferase